MVDLYREEILDHYKNPRNFGKIPNPDKEVREVNPLCGDEIEIFVLFGFDKKNPTGLKSPTRRVVKIKFEGKGCAVSIAAASMLTEYAKGKDIGGVKKLTEGEVLSWFGGNLTSSRRDCAFLPLKALKRLLES